MLTIVKNKNGADLRMWGLHVICNDQNGEFKMSETDMDNLWCQNISHHFCAK